MLAKLPFYPQPKVRTRLSAKDTARKADEQQLDAWRRAVRARDGHVCRVCKRHVVVSLELRANRAECHHITGRSHKPTRYDVRNGLLVCLGCHQRIEDGEVQLVGTKQFRLGERAYINADFPVLVKEFKA